MPVDQFKASPRVETRSVAGTGDYQTDTKPTVTVSDLVNIAKTISVEITGGYKANAVSSDGNTVTYAVYEDAGAAGELAEVSNTTDLSGETVTVSAEGF